MPMIDIQILHSPEAAQRRKLIAMSKYLQKTFNIDPERIGLYGGS